MSKLLAAIETEQQRINDAYDFIKENVRTERYPDAMALARALNGAARSQIADKIHDEWRAKGGRR